MLLSLFFGAYAFSYGFQTTLDNLYPNKLFPAPLRASAVGSIFAVGRVGASVSAFCFPHLMMYFSLDTLLLAGASVAVCSALCLSSSCRPRLTFFPISRHSSLPET